MASKLEQYLDVILRNRESRPTEAMLADEIIRLRALCEPELEKSRPKELVNFFVRGCDNPECKWFKIDRVIDKRKLCMDENDSIFLLSPFMCECSYHLYTEPMFRESVPPNPHR